MEAEAERYWATHKPGHPQWPKLELTGSPAHTAGHWWAP